MDKPKFDSKAFTAKMGENPFTEKPKRSSTSNSDLRHIDPIIAEIIAQLKKIDLEESKATPEEIADAQKKAIIKRLKNI